MAVAFLGLTSPRRAAADPVESLAAGAELLARSQAAAAVPWLADAASCDFAARDGAYLLLAEADLRAGNPAAALAAAQSVRCVADTVHGASADWLAAEALEALGPGEACLGAWREFLDGHPRDQRIAAAEVRFARACEAAGAWSEAAGAWRRAALTHPVEAPPDALDRARHAAEVAGVPFVPLTASQLLARGDALAAAGLHGAATAAYEDAERVGSGSFVARARLGAARSAFALRDDAAARDGCRAALEDAPSADVRGQCLTLLARIAWRLGDDQAFLAVTGEASSGKASVAPRWRDDVLLLRGSFLAEKRQWDAAIRELDRLPKECPRSSLVPEARWKAAWCRLLSGRPAEAAERFLALAKRVPSGLDPIGSSAAFWAAIARDRAGDKGRATAGLIEIVEREPFSYHGMRARSALAARLPADAFRAVLAKADASGVPFEAPPPPSLDSLHGDRYQVLRRARLPGLALLELEEHRRRVRDTDALVFELARARVAAGRVQSAQALLRARFPGALARPSRRTRDLWRLVYPDPHEETVRHASAQSVVDASLCEAVIRAESEWDPLARSGANARGLMQLLPATGERVAAEMGLPTLTPDDLFDPEINVRLGVQYLANLLASFGGDEAAAVAAYNAGEAKVAEWWRSYDAEGVGPAEERVERIPYRETRTYVMRVLEAAGWYRWLAESGPDEQLTRPLEWRAAAGGPSQ